MMQVGSVIYAPSLLQYSNNNWVSCGWVFIFVICYILLSSYLGRKTISVYAAENLDWKPHSGMEPSE